MESILGNSDITYEIIKKIDNNERKKLNLSSKNMNLYLKDYIIFFKYLKKFYNNKIYSTFTNSMNNDLKELFGSNLEKFKYINLNTDINMVFKNEQIYINYKSDFLLGKSVCYDNPEHTHLFICFRIYNELLKVYDYFMVDDITSDSSIPFFCYTNSSNNVILKKHDALVNHTYTCGCRNIFTCKNNDLYSISKQVFSSVLNEV